MQLEHLSETSLKQALGGTRLTYLGRDERVADTPSGESFARDGRWSMEGGRANPSGVFRVAGNRLVVLVGDASTCRAMFKASDGRMYISSFFAQSDLIPVSLSRIP